MSLTPCYKQTSAEHVYHSHGDEIVHVGHSDFGVLDESVNGERLRMTTVLQRHARFLQQQRHRMRIGGSVQRRGRTWSVQ